MSSDDRQREIAFFVDRLLSDPVLRTSICERLSSMAAVDGVIQSTLNRILRQWAIPAIVVAAIGIVFTVSGLKSIADTQHSVQKMETETRDASDAAAASAAKATKIAEQLSFTDDEITSILKFNDELTALRREFGDNLSGTLRENLLARPRTRELLALSPQEHVNVEQIGTIGDNAVCSIRDNLRAELPSSEAERTVWLTVAGEMTQQNKGESASRTLGFYLLKNWHAVDPDNVTQHDATKPLAGALYHATIETQEWKSFSITCVTRIPKGDFFVVPGTFGKGEVQFRNLRFTITSQPLVAVNSRQ